MRSNRTPANPPPLSGGWGRRPPKPSASTPIESSCPGNSRRTGPGISASAANHIGTRPDPQVSQSWFGSRFGTDTCGGFAQRMLLPSGIFRSYGYFGGYKSLSNHTNILEKKQHQISQKVCVCGGTIVQNKAEGIEQLRVICGCSVNKVETRHLGKAAQQDPRAQCA